MPAAANQRQAPSSRSLGAVHDGHEQSEFGRMRASLLINKLLTMLYPKSSKEGAKALEALIKTAYQQFRK
jgi:hypothetical protein